VSQDFVHQSHESCGGIRQPKSHDQPFEHALLGFEGSLPHIGGFDRNLVITKLQVNIVEIFGLLELVQKVINPWDSVPISDSDLVQHLIVNTESPSLVLLLYQYNRVPTG